MKKIFTYIMLIALMPSGSMLAMEKKGTVRDIRQLAILIAEKKESCDIVKDPDSVLAGIDTEMQKKAMSGFEYFIEQGKLASLIELFVGMDPEVGRLLLRTRADDGSTPLHCAQTYSAIHARDGQAGVRLYADIQDLFMRCGADSSLENNDGIKARDMFMRRMAEYSALRG